jgi:translation initiation factor 1
MAKKNRPKKINLEDLGGFVFSTNPEFEPPAFKEGKEEPLTPGEQLLELYFEKKGRGGKQVVIIKGFDGGEDSLKELGKKLKQHCGVGGSSKDGEIILQGNVRERATDFLKKEGYKTKRIGG